LSEEKTRAADGAEEDLEDLFEHAPCGYLSTAPDGRILKCNQTLLEWLGMERRALAGRRFQDLLNIAGKIYYETHFAPLLRMQGFFHEVALDLAGEDGRKLPVLVNAQERRDEAGEVRFIRITVFNASDRRRYEAQLLEARRQAEAASGELRALNHRLEERVEAEVAQRLQAEDALRQGQKMEAIGQLTGGVAHDFNNLLTVIMGGLDSIAKQVAAMEPGPVAERLLRSATMASHGARRAATLTARLLAFSRRQALDPKAVDPNRLVTGLADLLQRTLGETMELQTVAGAGLWRTLADPGELENVLVNLAVNARDAMPSGGRLTIETSNAYLDQDYVDSLPEPVAAGRYVLIAVSDTGCGMDQATLAKVFEPFFTTKPAGQGTGLGLSQVYGFVRQSNGHIRIYSEIGEGTTVKLYLPRASADAEADAPRAPPGPVRGGTETILLVEDDEDLRVYSQGVLTDLGYRVIAAADGPTALELVRAGQHTDLLFTDVVLPGGITGRELAQQMGAAGGPAKVLFTTGYTRNAIVHNGRLDPDVDMIGKPFAAADLARRIREILDR
jgi:PAS domain S-box-containing protein